MAADHWADVEDVDGKEGTEYSILNSRGALPDYTLDAIRTDPRWKGLGKAVSDVAREVHAAFVPGAGTITRSGIEFSHEQEPFKRPGP